MRAGQPAYCQKSATSLPPARFLFEWRISSQLSSDADHISEMPLAPSQKGRHGIGLELACTPMPMGRWRMLERSAVLTG